MSYASLDPNIQIVYDSDTDACNSNPCENDGVCTLEAGSCANWTCVCLECWSDDTCSTRMYYTTSIYWC